jgi:L-aspartate oxidase
VPVAPAQHYASGGVATDLWGRAGLPGLYATGEVACSGVHGANRLASNSLLEGLVFSRRIAEVLPDELPAWSDPVDDRRAAGLVPGDVRRRLQGVMTDRVGVLRSEKGLDSALADLDVLAAEAGHEPGPDAWEATNLVTVSRALAAAAALREETRGSHWRDDQPERDDLRWSGHVDVSLDGGVPVTAFHPAPATDGGA